MYFPEGRQYLNERQTYQGVPRAVPNAVANGFIVDDLSQEYTPFEQTVVLWILDTCLLAESPDDRYQSWQRKLGNTIQFSLLSARADALTNATRRRIKRNIPMQVFVLDATIGLIAAIRNDVALRVQEEYKSFCCAPRGACAGLRTVARRKSEAVSLDGRAYGPSVCDLSYLLAATSWKISA